MTEFSRSATASVAAMLAYVVMIRFPCTTTIGWLAGVYLLAAAVPRFDGTAKGWKLLRHNMDCVLSLALLTRYIFSVPHGEDYVSTLFRESKWTVAALGLMVYLQHLAVSAARKDGASKEHTLADSTVPAEGETHEHLNQQPQRPDSAVEDDQLIYPQPPPCVGRIRRRLPTIVYSAVCERGSPGAGIEGCVLEPSDPSTAAQLPD